MEERVSKRPSWREEVTSPQKIRVMNMSANTFLILHAYTYCILISITEKSILNKKEQSSKKTLRQSISDSSEPDSNSKYTPDQRASLLRMKSITNASEGVCSSILQQKGFNLEPSIEAYFKGDYDSKA